MSYICCVVYLGIRACIRESLAGVVVPLSSFDISVRQFIDPTVETGMLNHHARESGYFRSSDTESLLQRLKEMVKRGQVSESVLKAAEERLAYRAPVVKTRDLPRFEYVKGVTPVPRRAPSGAFGNLGSQVSMGRMRWTSDGVSIFSVADGKQLASTPAKPLNHYENIRMTKIQKAALQTPTVLGGYRVLPELTPGRALLWGTVLAVYGTSALVMSTASYLEIKSLGDVKETMSRVLGPFGEGLRSGMLRLAPVRGAGEEVQQEAWVGEFVSRLKTKLVKT